MTDKAVIVEAVIDAVAGTAAPETIADVQESVAAADVARIEAQADASVDVINAQAKADERLIMARMGSPELQERILTCEINLAEIKSLLLEQTEVLATVTNRLLSIETPSSATVIVATTPEPSTPPIASSEQAPLLNPENEAAQPEAKIAPQSSPDQNKKKRRFL